MKPVKIPVQDSIDLHTFQPKEVLDLLEDYFLICIDSGIFSVRIIHGKGKGILRNKVHSFLKKNSMVKSFHEASPQAGGWGATFVELQTKI